MNVRANENEKPKNLLYFHEYASWLSFLYTFQIVQSGEKNFFSS